MGLKRGVEGEEGRMREEEGYIRGRVVQRVVHTYDTILTAHTLADNHTK